MTRDIYILTLTGGHVCQTSSSIVKFNYFKERSTKANVSSVVSGFHTFSSLVQLALIICSWHSVLSQHYRYSTKCTWHFNLWVPNILDEFGDGSTGDDKKELDMMASLALKSHMPCEAYVWVLNTSGLADISSIGCRQSGSRSKKSS